MKDFNFKCEKCGNCCYTIIAEAEYPIFCYNYEGIFENKPKTSVIVHYKEKPEIENYIISNTNLKPKFLPMHLLFLRYYSIGFIYEYQLGVKKNRFCHYYSKKNRKCKIYEKRPAVCSYYPLMFSENNPRIPCVNLSCSVIKKELKKEFPNLKEGDPVIQKIEYDDLLLAFPREYKVFLKTRFDWFVKVSYISNAFNHLFIPPNEIRPNQIKDYRLVDMSEFFTWASKNLRTTGDRSILREVKENYNHITKRLLKGIK